MPIEDANEDADVGIRQIAIRPNITVKGTIQGATAVQPQQTHFSL
jgi:hypothetical protein